MLLSLLLSLVWTGDWALGANQPIATGCKDNNKKYKLEVQESVMVQEGLCVLVPCKILLPYSTYGTSGSWFRMGADPDSPVATNSLQKPVQKATKGRFYILPDLQEKNCSLHIRDAQRGDNGSYFFRAEKGHEKWDYCKNQISVHVTALTHIPNIDIPQTLEPGHPGNLTCSVPWACEQATPPIFSWMSAALTSLGPRTTHSSVLTLTPRLQDHGTNLTCQVNFPGAGVIVERTIQLNVTSGNPGTKAVAGVVLGAIGGSGVTALLAICLCLIFFTMKTCRKKAARTTVGMNPPTMGPASQGQQKDPEVHNPAEPISSSREFHALGVEQDLCYASISFHGARTWEDTSSQYSEIKVH